ncbi:hypothetical protein METUNv1_00531 [Methyloversatilis universalis FAM5]|uniref:Uncharacterized protein n=1 Tax=Methyloversatilis universalis (strain ATCC BAA-1314 / DSM 25237 / JCM 13912 / CCUG 52030 / FAM5) TaxID=1000565 RepID=F5R895_METUF|nr:hypothetical protein [Methyloversatilis universalis]EGK73353.1 hypothetical protein METUNv1_00531 [Methyloversatilis universalis FAM5]
MSLDQMRRGFPDAVRELRAVHDWTDADIADLREAVAKAVKAGQHLDLWAAWLGDYAQHARDRSAMVRRLEVEAAALAREANARLQPWRRVA